MSACKQATTLSFSLAFGPIRAKLVTQGSPNRVLINVYIEFSGFCWNMLEVQLDEEEDEEMEGEEEVPAAMALGAANQRG